VGGKFKTRNYRIEHGDAQWRDNNILEILPWEPENLLEKTHQQVPPAAVVLLR
jgi:hypothetical protein